MCCINESCRLVRNKLLHDKSKPWVDTLAKSEHILVKWQTKADIVLIPHVLTFTKNRWPNGDP